MAKKTKKEIAREKKIATLKKLEKKLEVAARKLDKKLDRERAVNQRKIDNYDKEIEKIERATSKQVEKLENLRDAIYAQKLPSQKSFSKVQDQLVKARNVLRALVHQAQVAADDEVRRPDREAGEVEEE